MAITIPTICPMPSTKSPGAIQPANEKRTYLERSFRSDEMALDKLLISLVVCAVICEPVSLAVLRLQGRYRVNAEIGLVLAISGGELFRIFRHFRADSLFRNNREFVVC
jgi:hypothetical protein